MPQRQAFDHVWRVRAKLSDRQGQRCRILARGRMNSVLVEFAADGRKVITSRFFVRKAAAGESEQGRLF